LPALAGRAGPEPALRCAGGATSGSLRRFATRDATGDWTYSIEEGEGEGEGDVLRPWMPEVVPSSWRLGRAWAWLRVRVGRIERCDGDGRDKC
jgi:hypothetical protein